MKKPIVRVIGPGGTNLIPGWGPALKRISFTDNEGGDADEVEMEFAVSPPFQAPPGEGTKYRIFYGWDALALRDAGLFSSQKPRLSFDASSGWVMTIAARSADYVDVDKNADSEHFEETTVGAIVKKIASRSGKSAIIDATLANIEVPYRLRWKQAPDNFIQSFVDEFGGTLKIAGGKMVVAAKGSGKTASGATIPPIVISAMEVEGLDLESDSKSKFKDIEAGWFDIDAGISEIAKASGIGNAARAFFLHPAPSKIEAEARAKAEALELARASVTGSITLEGRVDAQAGAPVILADFDGWGGFDLVASTIEHEITFEDDGGWMMTVELAKKSGS